MTTINRQFCCVQEAIEEIAILNPDYTLVKMHPTSFTYFIRGLGSNTNLFCTWKDKQAKILHFFTGAVDIDIQVNPLGKAETAYFINNETQDTLEVGLSG